MKKKFILVLMLIALVLVPATAASYKGSTDDGTVGVGLNLGTNTGLGLKFGFGKFDILANVGLSNFQVTKDSFTLGGDVAVSYQVYDIEIDRKNHMPITVGIGASTGFRFAEKFGFDLDILVPVGIEYTFPEVPINLYVRLAPGMSIMENTELKVGFAFAGYIGALWMFN